MGSILNNTGKKIAYIVGLILTIFSSKAISANNFSQVELQREQKKLDEFIANTLIKTSLVKVNTESSVVSIDEEKILKAVKDNFQSLKSNGVITEDEAVIFQSVIQNMSPNSFLDKYNAELQILSFDRN